MAGHFGALGFGVTTREELEALSVLAANVGEPKQAGDELYLRWVTGVGVEVWAQADAATKKIRGITPYFSSGEAALQGTIDEVLPNAKRRHDGSIAFIPAGDARRAALAGAVIALPDFQLAAPSLEKGKPATLSVAAFAHAFEELDDDTPPGGLEPGMILPAAQGLSVAAGTVEKAEKRTNPSGRREFIWVLLAVSGGTIDVLIDPELRDDPPEPGTACRGVFWLSARLR